ncbi:MAG TPA: septum formation initiator family protein, partial [Bacillota bacterium]|nr:septum formation initiator family protein [Bacillota bacterium]
REEGITPEEYRVLHSKKRIRWRFKPRSIWTLFTWGLALFLVCRILVFPFVEGVSNYFSKSSELSRLQQRYKDMHQQLVSLKKNHAYMQTNAYVEERGHQIGMIKPNESRMVVADSPLTVTAPNLQKKNKAEIYKN